MIYGVGSDILRLDRVQGVYERHGENFVNRLLMPEELRLFEYSKNPVRFLTMRFAAKEAIVKAMGTGFANGMWIRDCGTVPDRLGKPLVIFSARGQAKCAALGIGSGHLTLTDEAGLVVAFAALECAVPDSQRT
ncbi:MAG: holo-ACP synthase [Gammaproteobacteria bacterium]|nr:holo-ACP synthase [Gammaproteobacteria bacterium]